MGTIPARKAVKGSLPPTGRQAFFTVVVVRLCSRSFPSLISEIIYNMPGMLPVIKHTIRHHLPRGVPWLFCSFQSYAITSIRHSSLNTSTHDSWRAVYLSSCSQTQLNTIMEQNTGSICTAACHGSLVHEGTS